MKTFLVLLTSLIIVSCQTPVNAPKLPRKIKSYVWTESAQAFCRDDKNNILDCLENDKLIAYTFEDNATVLSYIVDLNTRCKKWKGVKPAKITVK